jgi:soluble lytic murein transglycosylase-like protein
MDAVIGVESGGRPGVLGPQTPYGRAQGLSQMLPATAQQMASKLGVPWRPDLMTGTSRDAAAYQRALGQAYLEEGIAATGSVADGLKYYHGGPNRRMWGPKTRRYADTVLSRLGGQ